LGIEILLWLCAADMRRATEYLEAMWRFRDRAVTSVRRL
jgi:hypothetical protein